MTLILENGSGVTGANAYADAAFVTAYLTARGRETENGWSTATAGAQASAAIKGTDYIELRFGGRIKGTRLWRNINVARASLEFTGQPTAGEIVTIGSSVYTFQTTLSAAGDVLIGSSTAVTLQNLILAVSASAQFAGSAFHQDTVVNAEATLELLIGDILLAVSKTAGTAGNSVVSTTDVSAASWNFSTLSGGTNVIVPQPLSFPRTGLVDRSGIQVVGVPLKAKEAASEYAVRSLAAELVADPTVDAYGGQVTGFREKVGPIESEFTYLAGSAGAGRLTPYPAADRLMADFVRRGGVSIRG